MMGDNDMRLLQKLGHPEVGLGLGLANGGRPRALSRALRVLIVGDSQTAGRGTGTGIVAMDGARALSWPTKMRDHLIAQGHPASSESYSEANNTGGTLVAYDPRVTQGTWTIGSGQTASGLLMTKNVTSGTSFRFAPSTSIDTFEVFYPINTYGTMNYNIDGAGTTGLNEAGTLALGRTLVSTTLGTHDIRFQPAAATAVYVGLVMAYNSAVKDFRIINCGVRNWSTTDWTLTDFPWRGYPSIPLIAPDITLISLGINDLRTGGALNSVSTFMTNMQSIITQAKAGGGSVGLVLPMPINTANEGSFTQADLLGAYQGLSATNNCPLLRTDSLLGTWAEGSVAGQTTDDLHWNAGASAALGSAAATMVCALSGIV